MVKYILVTGGVLSGIGKGVIASSTGLLLRTRGLNVTSIKIDPYLNIDAGTLTPLDHGEVFVLKDGGEVDLDLGNYERFLDIELTRENNITTGKIYRDVIERERKGDYLGKTVQVVPHITDAVQEWLQRVASKPIDTTGEIPDVCIIELGGTVGDIESAPFVEAMRQFQFRVGPDNFCLIHVSLVPIVGAVGEQKTKPTQSSIRDLRSLGLTPDIIACRSSKPLDEGIQSKISMFCHVTPEQVLAVHDCKSVYHVPLLLQKQGILNVLEKKLKLPPAKPEGAHLLTKWKQVANRLDHFQETVRIALVGKYTDLHDSYISVVKSLEHASLACSRKLEISWIEAETLEPSQKTTDPAKHDVAWAKLKAAQGILVPGGFGTRGLEGMVLAAKYAREHQVPYLGICLGMQIAVIEFARHVCGLEGAHSAEADPATPHPVVIFMPEGSKTHMGGTMRLGDRATIFDSKHAPSSVLRRLYNNADVIVERHRHRYEVNPAYIDQIEAKGLRFVGKDEKGERMIMLELEGHPYFVGAQFHPEYKTRPLTPVPTFMGLVMAAIGSLQDTLSATDLRLTNYASVESSPADSPVLTPAHSMGASMDVGSVVPTQ